MSALAIRLACHLTEELFGETVEKVCWFLLENGASSLQTIATRTKVPRTEVKKALCVMINHRIASFESNKKNLVEYSASVNRCLLLARYPRFIYCAKMLYDDAGELIVEEILHGGQMTMTIVLQNVTERLQKAVGDSKKIETSMVRGKFIKLVETRFIQRVPDPEIEAVQESTCDPDVTRQQAALYRLPSFVHDIGTPLGKRKRDPKEDEDGRRSKRAKTDDLGESEYYIDEDILWQANLDRFHQYFRDHEIVSAALKSNGSLASEIVRTMLRISEVTTDKLEVATTPTSYHDIFRALPANLNIDRNKFDQYLKILTENQTRIVRKVSEAGGRLYDIDLQKGSLAVTLSCIESVVQERFGSKSHRIFKLLVLKKYLEHKQIESNVLIPAKEAKELLYQMFAEGFVSVQELSKAPDHAPSRTYYPFFVNLDQVSLQLRRDVTRLLLISLQEESLKKRK
ncbi:putative DNA-directed RNA polymerase III subunit RPC3-like [Apostichopus japonicus]|uniref:DNA-directed RNA polymerase III subunit RPC3 n=1 Tax=Stichopus japonicus TaxID=307972 RepID=A0A2G8K2D3_STIJA|nr:putative DNA-directed RNA polymerase III subunit RPC3-like [Apostichopus japonicus]